MHISLRKQWKTYIKYIFHLENLKNIYYVKFRVYAEHIEKYWKAHEKAMFYAENGGQPQ